MEVLKNLQLWNGKTTRRRHDMAKVTFKFTDSEPEHFKLSDDIDELIPPYVEGQILFVQGEDEGRIFLDFKNSRMCYSGVSSSMLGKQVNFIGISSTDPSSGTATVGGQAISPNINDMVVYGKKEYLYRNGENGPGWYEIGDEESPEWNY